jgi:hypothetical protein
MIAEPVLFRPVQPAMEHAARLRWCLAALILATSLPAAALPWEPSEIATGKGERGPWQQNESRYDYVDDPAVALDDEGRAIVAWVHQGTKDVFVNGVNVSRSPETFSWLPRIALSGGKVYVLWQEIIFSGGSHGGDMLFAFSEDGGKRFSDPVNLSNSVAGDGKGRITAELWHNGSYDLAVGPDGAVHAAWTEYEGRLWYTRSTDGGRSFSPRIHVNAGYQRPARGPSLALGRDGAVHLAWTDGDIQLAASTNGGVSFDKPNAITRTRAYSDAPRLAVDNAGTLHLVYAERNRIWYANRSLQSPRAISGEGAGFPALRADGAGRLYVLWERFAERNGRPRGLELAVSSDAGRSFSPPALVPHSADPSGAPNGSFQGLLMQKLAVTARGDIAVVNSSLKDGERSRVWLIRAACPACQPQSAGRGGN